MRDGDHLSDWSSLGWIAPFSFCKNNSNTTNPHQASLQTFCACHCFLTSEKLPVLTVFVYDDFKKCPSKPRFANDLGFSSPKFILKKQQITIESKLTKNSGISIWSPRHRFCSQIAAHETKNHQPNQQLSKLVFLVGFARRRAAILYPKNAREPHEKNPLIFLYGHGNPLRKLNRWQPKKMKNTHEHPWAMSTREFTWTPLSFINDAADKLGFGQLFSHFWFITVCCCFCICWFHFSFSFCFFILCWLGAPENYPLPLLQNMFFFLFGYVWKWGDLFSLQRNHFGVKKGHFMLRHTHLLILFWTCVFVASMLCWLAPSKTYPTEIYRFTLAQKASL